MERYTIPRVAHCDGGALGENSSGRRPARGAPRDARLRRAAAARRAQPDRKAAVVNITDQALGLAEPAHKGSAAPDGVKVAPEAMKSPGMPVPDDPVAVAMFTAHRLDDILHRLGHASERMKAARSASGDLRKYHAVHVARHLKKALDAAHELTVNIRAHYPAEAAELEHVKQEVGLAKAVSDDAKAATTAHLLETTLHELTHGSRHAQQMTEDTPDEEWTFNADHCEKHLGGAVEHAGKLAAHFRDNYPDVAKRLEGLDEVSAPAEEDSGKRDGEPQHARYGKGGDETITAQMANPETLSGQ